MHDLVIRGATIVDGTGAAAFTGEVAITDGLITAVHAEADGHIDGRAGRVIDADGLLLTPGFVDMHTHYDGQVTWDPLLTPSCWQGVTTVVMGNCGVGFAPVRPNQHDWLIGLMEGVEDIPGTALHEGIQWGWESFPEYLDVLDGLPLALDVGTQVPHGAVRGYVMGERGADNQPATADDIAAMARIVEEGMLAGALGVSTSRTVMHVAVDGRPVPGTFAAEDELFGLGEVLGRLGTGVFELAPAGALGEDLEAAPKEIDWMRRLAAAIRRPVCFGLTQNHVDPEAWRQTLHLAEQAAADGADLRAQVHARTVSLLLGLRTLHPLMYTPSWAALASLPINVLVERLADADLRMQTIAELEAAAADPILAGFMNPERMFPMGDPPDYEPPASRSLAGLAAAAGRSPWEITYDMLLEQHGSALINSPILGYAHGNLNANYDMLMSPISVFGLGDGGAHAGQTCDASSTTFLLTHWVRDRVEGDGRRLGLEHAVQKLTSETADLYGLTDRGRIVPGKRADLNLIDFERLSLPAPTVAYDLPAGARRLLQKADGYVSTIVAGTTIMAEGSDTGARPGALLRGAR